MPIYEYACSSCGHHLETMQKMSDEPLKDCPDCQKPTLQKLISAAGFQLKGTGWYATDFRNKGKVDTTKTETKQDTSSSGAAANDTKKSSGTNEK